MMLLTFTWWIQEAVLLEDGCHDRYTIINVSIYLNVMQICTNVFFIVINLQSNFGAVSLNYTLSDQPTYGNYSIRVHALQQIEEKQFYVEEYYQPRFEVNTLFLII
jgi:hypothetical protein